MSLKGTISKESIHRLVKDVSYIMKNPLNDNGIYYVHDEENMLKGYALIIGPSDTPYFGGYYLFEFTFPTDYPFSPPVLKYMTNNGIIRFNPNLYTNGKVCISILNTWHGDAWSSCQSISTILLTLSTILNSKPLLNEPGITESHNEIIKYNQLITFSNISIAICDVLDNKIGCPWLDKFHKIIEEQFLNNYHAILEKINLLEKDEKENVISVMIQFYRLNVLIDYGKLKKRFIESYEKIKNKDNKLNEMIYI